jgi:hypothetical protein
MRKTLLELETERPPPTAVDVNLCGVQVDVLLKTDPMAPAIAPFEEVCRNMYSTGYDPARINFVRGKVEEHRLVPVHVALACPLYLRLFIDYYGHFVRSKKAVDEYFQRHSIPIFLNRIDYTGRPAVKSL